MSTSASAGLPTSKKLGVVGCEATSNRAVVLPSLANLSLAKRAPAPTAAPTAVGNLKENKVFFCDLALHLMGSRGGVHDMPNGLQAIIQNRNPPARELSYGTDLVLTLTIKDVTDVEERIRLAEACQNIFQSALVKNIKDNDIQNLCEVGGAYYETNMCSPSKSTATLFWYTSNEKQYDTMRDLFIRSSHGRMTELGDTAFGKMVDIPKDPKDNSSPTQSHDVYKCDKLALQSPSSITLQAEMGTETSKTGYQVLQRLAFYKFYVIRPTKRSRDEPSEYSAWITIDDKQFEKLLDEKNTFQEFQTIANQLKASITMLNYAEKNDEHFKIIERLQGRLENTNEIAMTRYIERFNQMLPNPSIAPYEQKKAIVEQLTYFMGIVYTYEEDPEKDKLIAKLDELLRAVMPTDENGLPVAGGSLSNAGPSSSDSKNESDDMVVDMERAESLGERLSALKAEILPLENLLKDKNTINKAKEGYKAALVLLKSKEAILQKELDKEVDKLGGRVT